MFGGNGADACFNTVHVLTRAMRQPAPTPPLAPIFAQHAASSPSSSSSASAEGGGAQAAAALAQAQATMCWSWSTPLVTGLLRPAPRCGHAMAPLLSTEGGVLVYGGWDTLVSRDASLTLVTHTGAVTDPGDAHGCCDVTATS